MTAYISTQYYLNKTNNVCINSQKEMILSIVCQCAKIHKLFYYKIKC